MSYTASPRPNFDQPTHIPYASVTLHLWGDPESGEVADWIYVSSDHIHQIVFGLPPGGWFRHSESYRTVFAADEVLYVLSGAMTIANPETGEVQRALPGEAVFFRRDTWHHAYNYSREPLRVLELFAPPPSQGTSGAYARTRPYVAEPRYAQDQYLGQWPLARAERAAGQCFQVLREADLLWRLEGCAQEPTPVGLWASTEHITVGQVELQPGQKLAAHRHAGAESLYVVAGTVHLRTPDHDGQKWYELRPGDGFYLPPGVAHQYYNMGGEPTKVLFGVAPGYLPEAGA